jgi:NTP pyrophosphatase (non-canonical NTP hydrolase)
MNMMTFDDYQAQARRTMNTALSEDEARTMTALGLVGEAGECSELIKKHVFHNRALDREELQAELGDVLWYVAMLADACGLSLQEIAAHNVEKLIRRYPEGF